MKFLFHIRKEAPKSTFDHALRWVRTMIGFTVLAIGVALLVLPGPAVVVIPVGLAILATEYAWARRYLKKFRESGEKIAVFFTRRKRKPESTADEK